MRDGEVGAARGEVGAGLGNGEVRAGRVEVGAGCGEAGAGATVTTGTTVGGGSLAASMSSGRQLRDEKWKFSQVLLIYTKHWSRFVAPTGTNAPFSPGW